MAMIGRCDDGVIFRPRPVETRTADQQRGGRVNPIVPAMDLTARGVGIGGERREAGIGSYQRAEVWRVISEALRLGHAPYIRLPGNGVKEEKTRPLLELGALERSGFRTTAVSAAQTAPSRQVQAVALL